MMDESFAATSKAFHLLFYLCLLSHVLHTQPSKVGLLYNDCGASNDTASSAYQENLNLLLSSLTSNGEVSGFYNDSVGALPDRAYGLVLCRGDASSGDCGRCLRRATQDVVELCAYNKRAILWYEDCLLRYADMDFFSPSSFNGSDSIYTWTFQNISQAEGPDLNPLTVVDELVRRAPSIRLMYLKVRASGTRYGVAQCTRDLSRGSCEACLRYCRDVSSICCAGKVGWRVLTPNCLIRYEAHPDLSATNDSSSPAPQTNARDHSGERRKLSRSLVLMVVISAILVIVFGLLIYLLFSRRSNRGLPQKDVPSSIGFASNGILGETSENSSDLPLINFETILAASNNFSDDNKIGEGGFGPVYKGILPDSGKEVAIKRLSASSTQGQQEFMNEVSLIAQLQHRNLVRLLYYCMEREEMLLVYEYMTNRSLDTFIFDPAKRVEMNWRTRLDIIAGIGRGLLYLHQDSRLTVIHRDLKSSNVLLDENMNPKISDFGMARVFGGQQIQENTNTVVGTLGYISPEYAMQGLFSVKSDVFSFGVILLEILSGQKSAGFYLSDHATSLIQYASGLWCSKKALELLDPLVTQQFSKSKLLRCINIGLLCVQEDAADRPSMSEVYIMLASESVALCTPKKPAFSVGRNALELSQTTKRVDLSRRVDLSSTKVQLYLNLPT